MTIQTKHYIDLSDIINFRFECKTCGTSLTVPLKDRLMNRLEKCPGCYQPWAILNGASYEPLFDRFREAVLNLDNALVGPPPAPLGLRFSLEIKAEALPD